MKICCPAPVLAQRKSQVWNVVSADMQAAEAKRQLLQLNAALTPQVVASAASVAATNAADAASAAAAAGECSLFECACTPLHQLEAVE